MGSRRSRQGQDAAIAYHRAPRRDGPCSGAALGVHLVAQLEHPVPQDLKALQGFADLVEVHLGGGAARAGHDLSGPGDGVALVVQQALDPEEAGEVLLAVQPLARAGPVRLHAKLGLPVAQHVGVDADELGDLSDAEVELVGDLGVVRVVFVRVASGVAGGGVTAGRQVDLRVVDDELVVARSVPKRLVGTEVQRAGLGDILVASGGQGAGHRVLGDAARHGLSLPRSALPAGPERP